MSCQSRFSKVPRTFQALKAIRKLRHAYSVKLVFSYVVKGIKIKITARFRASRRLRFEDTKRIMSPEMRPKSFGTFEKQAPGPVSRKSRKLFASGKQFVKLQPAYSVKLVLSYVVKGIKIKIAAKFLGARRLRFEDTKV